MIAIGDKFPQTTFKIMNDNGPVDVTSEELFSGRKIVFFALPGAFTPTCHSSHLPGFLENYELILSKGIDGVYVSSVNDIWVMEAWAKSTRAKGKIGFLADGAGEATRKIGMEVDAPGMGQRSRRFSMILVDGVVKTLNVEVKRGQTIVSGSATILQQLSLGNY